MGYFTRMIDGPPERDPFPVDSTVYATNPRGHFGGFHRVTAIESGGWSVTLQPIEAYDYYQQHEPTAAAQLLHYARLSWMAPEGNSPVGDARSIGIEPSGRLQQDEPVHCRGDYALRHSDGSEMFLWDGQPLAIDTAGAVSPRITFGEMWNDLVQVEAHERRHFDLGEGPLEVGTILQAADRINGQHRRFLQVTAQAFRVGEFDSTVIVRPISQSAMASHNVAQAGPVESDQRYLPTPGDFTGPARVERVCHEPASGYYVADGANPA